MIPWRWRLCLCISQRWNHQRDWRQISSLVRMTKQGKWLASPASIPGIPLRLFQAAFAKASKGNWLLKQPPWAAIYTLIAGAAAAPG
jgi:hypothetical protein